MDENPNTERINKAYTNVVRGFSKPFVNADKYSKENYSEEKIRKDRIMASALSGIGSMAISGILSKLINPPNKPIKYMTPIMSGLSGALVGASVPDILSYIAEEKKGKISKDESKRLIKEKIYNSSLPPFNKEAGISGKILKSGWGLAKGVSGLAWKGLNPRSGLLKGEKASFGRKALSAATYGTIGGSAIYGGSKLVNRMGKNVGPDHTKRSGNNYTTFLRNNILSGNIQPSELSQRDLISVRKLGVK